MKIFTLFAAFTLTWFALTPPARAQACNGTCDFAHENTALGDDALHNDRGVRNTAIGRDALYGNYSGSYNTAIGAVALGNTIDADTTGSYNTATGHGALYSDSTGSNNTATGASALLSNTTGSNNNAFGANALSSNTTGPYNNAFGNGALASNTTGDRNTAIGEGAMISSITGYQNTAVGVSALRNNSTGFYNVAIGQDACNLNGSGSGNTGVGWQALQHNSANNNTGVGMNALLNSSGSNNVSLGANAGINLSNGSNNIDIGNAGVAGESAKIHIGKQGTQNGTFIAGIYNVNEGGTIKPVYINSTGRLGTQPPASARKFKEDIRAMEKTSEGILKLKPVTFRYKNDTERTPQFGLVAEDVANVNPDLVVRDENGEIYTVRYEAVNAMLLNEFLKEHRKVEKLEATVAKQHEDFEAALADLKGQIQKVSAQLELSKRAPEVAENNQ